MKTPKLYNELINEKKITNEIIAECIYSVNKRAKNYRDKIKEYKNGSFHQHLESNIEKVENSDIERIILKMREINPKASIFKEDWRKITSEEIEAILEESRKNIRNAKEADTSDKIHSSEEHHHHPADNIFDSISFSNIKNFSEKNMEELKEKIAEGYFGKVIRAKGIIPSDSEESSENFKYWHFDSNLSSFNFNKMKIENLPNFDSDDKSGNVILIGSNLKRNKIEKYFLK